MLSLEKVYQVTVPIFWNLNLNDIVYSNILPLRNHSEKKLGSDFLGRKMLTTI